MLSAGVVTYFDPVEARKSGLQFAMHGLHLRSRLGSATNVRLIRDHNEKESGVSPIDKNRPASGSVRTIHVAPAITDQITGGKIYS